VKSTIPKKTTKKRRRSAWASGIIKKPTPKKIKKEDVDSAKEETEEVMVNIMVFKSKQTHEGNFSKRNFQNRITYCRIIYRLRGLLKGIVGASSNVLGKNKAFLKLKYLL
jgi:hypothetical protein